MNWPLRRNAIASNFWAMDVIPFRRLRFELHCRGPALHDHLLKNPGGPVLALTRIERWALGVGVERCATGLAEPASDGLRRTTNGRMKAVRVFFNIVLNPRVIGFLDYVLERAAIFLMGTSVK